MTSNKQIKLARVAFVNACASVGVFTTPQARYEFDKFLTKNDVVKTFEEYLKTRRNGAAFTISKEVKEFVWSLFSSSF